MEATLPGSLGPILIVEDEQSVAEAVKYNLEREGYRAVIVSNGADAIAQFSLHRPSLVLLDLMLSGMSGLDVCRSIRAQSKVPIMMLTAKDAEVDKVTGLEVGADDYMTKPFSMRELLARVRAHLRRSASGDPDDDVERSGIIEIGPISMDQHRHEVKVRGGVVAFPPKEFALLEAFLLRPGRLLTRDLLISEVWGPDYFGDTRTLDVHIKRLRVKIEQDPHDPRCLKTIRGLGYKLEVPPPTT